MINSGRVQIIKTEKSLERVEDLLLCLKTYYNTNGDDECDEGNLRMGVSYYASPENYSKVHLYITSFDIPPKDGDYVYHSTYRDTVWKMEERDGRNFGVSMTYENKEPYELIGFMKIISTNDEVLINDGVNSIGNDFINYFIEKYNDNHSYTKVNYVTNSLRTQLRDGGFKDIISYSFIIVSIIDSIIIEKCETIDDVDSYSYNKALLIFKESENREANMDNVKDVGAVSAIQLGYKGCMIDNKI